MNVAVKERRLAVIKMAIVFGVTAATVMVLMINGNGADISTGRNAGCSYIRVWNWTGVTVDADSSDSD